MAGYKTVKLRPKNEKISRICSLSQDILTTEIDKNSRLLNYQIVSMRHIMLILLCCSDYNHAYTKITGII